MAGSESYEQESVVRAKAANLRIDAATAEVVSRFQDAGIGCLLLKGPALAEWYAADPTRSYLDCDLWVRPTDLTAAGAVLTDLGFEPHIDEHGLPDWWLEHATPWVRETDWVTVDVHRYLQGVGVSPEAAWDLLSAQQEVVTVAGQSVPRLSAAGRALYVTLHAAHHGRGVGKALVHLSAALSNVPEETWHEAAEIASELDALDAFAAGLYLVPAGQLLAERLNLPKTQSVKAVLQASTAPPVALGIEQLAGAETAAERFRIGARKLFPPPGFIRHWWPPAARNRPMLVIGYLYRPLWLIRHSPAALRAWLHARGQARSSR